MDNDKKPSATFGDIFGVLGLMLDTAQYWVPPLGGALAWLLHAPWYIIIAVMVAVLILLIVLIRKLRLSVMAWLLFLAHGLLPVKRDYECRDKVAEYTYKSRETMNFRVSYEAKFNSGTHRSIPERIKWSAGDVDNITPVVQGQTISLVPKNEKDDILFQLGYQDLQLGLPKLYSKHDHFFRTGYYCECPPDPEHKAMTCLVIGVYQKVNGLTLRVRFDKSLTVINVRKLKYARYLDEEPYESKHDIVQMDEGQRYGYVEFKIKHPIPGGKYAIDWEFSDL